MESVTDNASSTETPLDLRAVEHSSFVRDEGGQISILVILCVIPFILLLAFIFNSAKQTSRKIEMQGAADAAAVASAVTTARGMNFMVLNNNAMAEVLSLMIAVRSLRNMSAIMRVYVPIKAAAVCAAAVACLGLCPNLDEECFALTVISTPKWFSEAEKWSSIDRTINNESGGVGWRLLDLLDGLNSVVKNAFPIWAAYQARDFAKRNGADLDPIYGLVLGGKSEPSLTLGGVSLSLPIPTFPVARGPEGAIAYQAEDCQYKFLGLLNGLVTAYILTIDWRNSLEAIAIYQGLRWANLNHLKGDWGAIGSIFSSLMGMMPGQIMAVIRKMGALGQFLGIELLSWRDEPPKPMLLTDNPGENETDEREVDEETLNNLRPFLQHLGFALGRVPTGSPIGGELFLNKPNALVQMQFTYAQAEIYNPTKWDMWTQDWRAQLMRSKLFDEKVNEIFQILPLPSGLDWSFVNTH